MMLTNGNFGAWSVVAAVVLGILVLKLFSSRHKNLPPGPRGLPIIGALYLLGKHPQHSLAKLAKAYGPVMSLWFGQKLTVVATSPAAAKEFLKTQGPNFLSRPKTSTEELALTDGVVLTNESTTRMYLRKILHTQLSSTKQLQHTVSMRAEEIAHVLHMIPQDGATAVQVRTYVELVVTNILSRMIFKKRFMAITGKEDEGLEIQEVRNFRTLLQEIAECTLRIDPGDFIPILKWIDMQGFRRRTRNLKKRMDAFMSKIISEHLVQRRSHSFSEKDLVDVLLDGKEDKTLKFEITNNNVRSTIWDAITAATTTTTDAVEWTMAECIHNPHIMKKARAELDTIVGKARRVEDADIPNLKYLQAIIKETFRLHMSPPLMLPHENENACKVFGYDIPVGTMVLINSGAIARDPSIWEDPLIFKPERFLEGMPHANTDVQGKHFELLTFGCGRRACPGMALGIAMVQIIFATFLHSFDWSLPDDLQPMDLDMSEGEGMLGERAQTLIAIPKARLSISPIV